MINDDKDTMINMIMISIITNDIPMDIGIYIPPDIGPYYSPCIYPPIYPPVIYPIYAIYTPYIYPLYMTPCIGLFCGMSIWHSQRPRPGTEVPDQGHDSLSQERYSVLLVEFVILWVIILLPFPNLACPGVVVAEKVWIGLDRFV